MNIQISIFGFGEGETCCILCTIGDSVVEINDADYNGVMLADDFDGGWHT